MADQAPETGTPGETNPWLGYLSLHTIQWRLWHLPLALLAVCVLYSCLTGIWMVRQNEQGVVLRFGRAVRTYPAGMHFTLPYPIETLRRVPTTEVRTLPVGFKFRDQLRGIPPSPNERQWLTGDTNIVELKVVIQYRVNAPIDYLFGVSDLRDGRRRDFALVKFVESALTRLMGKMPVDEALSSGKASLQEETRQQAQRLADAVHLGLQIASINIVEVNPPPEVIAAFNDVSSAKADRERIVSEADAYAKDLLPRARAQANRTLQDAEIYRSQRVNTARGASERFLKLAVEVQAAPAISRRRLWLETIETVLSRADVVVYPRSRDGVFSFTQIE
ncbi:MAG: hypothetical protein ETSY1_29900 [Candidatus Entotheonella factor]|uniref:Protein HflK n=1 Tax=Entotheonella factor TaxID=1429438 RepID=W4LE45_ENTF1|nr:MAG: hypothetical protein ETSY1_29900 [Candidatus Entotheonella factor]